MAQGMTRREFAAGAAGLAVLGFGSGARGAGDQTLRLIASSDLRVLDPIWTTAGISRAHGYMVFDTPFALDAKFKPQPQMVGDYDISPDQLRYSFTLREGLKFHDGEPVHGTDCVASLRRWMVRDAFGQSLATAIAKIEPAGDKGFTIGLKEPFPLLLDALAKIAGPPFIMPERLARTDPYQQITEAVGSGPYKFGKEEFQPGHKAVYVKNADYVPRTEPPSWASGGKVVKVDRVEWLFVPDDMTKAAALASGEADWWENPTPDIWPVLATDPEITLAELDPLGSMGTLRFNHLHPPFDSVKMRQAPPSLSPGFPLSEVQIGHPVSLVGVRIIVHRYRASKFWSPGEARASHHLAGAKAADITNETGSPGSPGERLRVAIKPTGRAQRCKPRSPPADRNASDRVQRNHTSTGAVRRRSEHPFALTGDCQFESRLLQPRAKPSLLVSWVGPPPVAKQQVAAASGGHGLLANKGGRIRGTPAMDRRRPATFPAPASPNAAAPLRAAGCRQCSG